TLPTCYQAADLFVFASETETQGLVLAEAAACGLPAVAVAAPGCNEVVRDGATGVLTKGDPGGLAEAVIGLLVDVERRRVMGARCGGCSWAVPRSGTSCPTSSASKAWSMLASSTR